MLFSKVRNRIVESIAVQTGSGVPTPERKRGRAGCLYLMASDAYDRGDAKLAEIFIARANQYADEATTQVAQQEPTKTWNRLASVRAD